MWHMIEGERTTVWWRRCAGHAEHKLEKLLENEIQRATLTRNRLDRSVVQICEVGRRVRTFSTQSEERRVNVREHSTKRNDGIIHKPCTRTTTHRPAQHELAL